MIFYFSATGNCKYVATTVAAELSDQAISIMDCLTDGTNIFVLEKGEMLGIVAPTYAWGLPSVVIDFLQSITLQTEHTPYVYFIATYGTTPANSGYFADKYLQARTQMSITAYFSVKMPDTWTPMFDLSDKNKVAAVNARVEPQLEDIINKIKKFSAGDFMKNKVPRFTAAFYRPYYEHMRRTKNFVVENNCSGCGLCAVQCPAQAIALQAAKPVWIKDKCVMCLGCLHRCPVFAIQYGKRTKRHGQYTNPHVKLQL